MLQLDEHARHARRLHRRAQGIERADIGERRGHGHPASREMTVASRFVEREQDRGDIGHELNAAGYGALVRPPGQRAEDTLHAEIELTRREQPAALSDLPFDLVARQVVHAEARAFLCPARKQAGQHLRVPPRRFDAHLRGP
jgi:hypothetical protein